MNSDDDEKPHTTINDLRFKGNIILKRRCAEKDLEIKDQADLIAQLFQQVEYLQSN